MSLEQVDIDALLGAAAADAAGAGIVDTPAPPPSPAPDVPTPPAPTDNPKEEPLGAAERDELSRLLDISVPLAVTLADREMTVEEVLEITVGTIIEFDRLFDAELLLSVADEPIGHGQAVKIGENFGLRVTHIMSPEDRVAAMGVGD